LVFFFFSLAHSFTRSLILFLNIAQASSASQGQILIHPNLSVNIRGHAGDVNRSLNIGTPPPFPLGIGNISQCHLRENMKRMKGKKGKCERKGKVKG
jgi:hypothetical protein